MTHSNLLYVSLHIPKTGGGSFRHILEQKFGEKLQFVYREQENCPVQTNPDCIHGHKIFQVYMDVIAEHTFVKWLTFLRDPLQSAISNYYYIKHRHSLMGDEEPFTDKGLENWLTHTTPFVFPNPPGYNHNRYFQWFEKYPFEKYDFIGLTEKYNESLVLLYKEFDWQTLYYKYSNLGQYSQPNLAADVVEKFHELNSKDYAIYARANKLFELKKQQYGAQFEHDLSAFRIALNNYQSCS